MTRRRLCEDVARGNPAFRLCERSEAVHMPLQPYGLPRLWRSVFARLAEAIHTPLKPIDCRASLAVTILSVIARALARGNPVVRLCERSEAIHTPLQPCGLPRLWLAVDGVVVFARLAEAIQQMRDICQPIK